MAASLLPWIAEQFFDANGDPLNAGKLYAYIAGTSTPQNTYEDSTLVTANPNPIILGADGRPPDPIFLLATGYKFTLKTSADVTLWTIDNVSDPGYVFSETIGTLQTAGGKNVTSGYAVLATDRLVTVSSTGGANPCVINLPAAADFSGLLVIKNMGTIALAVTPNGTETIDSLAAPFTVAAASSPTFPAVFLASDGSGAWWKLN